MTLDPELDGWRLQWQTRDAVPADVRRRVERDVRWMRLSFVVAGTVTVLFGGGMVAWALVSGDADLGLLAVATWVFIGITWAVSMTIAGGAHRTPASITTAAFLEFSIAQRLATRRGIAAGAVLYVGFAIFVLAWRFRTLGGAVTPDLGRFLAARWMFWTVTAVVAVVAVWAWRALGRELEVLRNFRRDE